MAIIHYREYKPYLTELAAGKTSSPFPVYLFFGEEAIYKPALDLLLDVLVPAQRRKFDYEAFEGRHENVLEAVRYLNTYSLSGGVKVVGLLDAALFASKQGAPGLEAATDAPEKEGEGEARDMSDMLLDALQYGFPKNHHLVISAETVDRRRRLFKVIDELGLIVDCAIPKGDRKADRAVQDAALAMKKEEILGKYGKKISPAAYAALYEMTGFDLRAFANNLTKLVDFIGDKPEIGEADVAFVLNRTKQDPIYEFTNAVTDRNLDDTLFYLGSLLRGGFHTLQIMAALANQIRRLIVVKAFGEKLPRGLWPQDASYAYFQKAVFPLIIEHDKAFLDQVTDWDTMLAGGTEGFEKRKPVPSAPKKAGATTDLLIAPNPKSPFPAFKTMQKADRFSKQELLKIMEELSRADGLLKSSDHDPRSVIENILIKICSGQTT